MTRSSSGTLGGIACLAAPLVAGAAGAIASARAAQFYSQLDKPSWAPPSWLFGPVWTILYIMMAVAALLVWQRRNAPGARAALTLFFIHLIANAAWSWLFFRWQQGLGSFICIIALWIAIATLVAWFWRIRPAASLLLVPYLAWVSFASFLNFAVWRANPGLL